MKLNSSFFYFKQAQSFGPYFEYHVAFQDQSDCIGEDGTNWSYFTLVYDFAVWYIVLKELHHRKYCENWFFSIKVFFTDTDDSQDSSGREGTNLINLFLPSSPPSRSRTFRLSFQLRMWADHPVFLIAQLVSTRQLLDEIYHLD